MKDDVTRRPGDGDIASLTDVLEALHEGVVLFDAKGLLLTINAGAREMLFPAATHLGEGVSLAELLAYLEARGVCGLPRDGGSRDASYEIVFPDGRVAEMHPESQYAGLTGSDVARHHRPAPTRGATH